MTNATTQGVNAIMISNNIGDQIGPAVKAAHDKGIKIVTWDSPIPSAENEDVFVAQVDFTETGKVMADMALKILRRRRQVRDPVGLARRRQPERLDPVFHDDFLKSDPKYAKLEEVDLVYGNDEAEKSYNEALALVDKHPDLQLIMAPTSIGIVAAAKAMQDENLCDKVKVSGLGAAERDARLHDERLRAGVRAVELRRPRLPRLLHRLPARHRRSKAEEGEKFTAGRMGEYTIAKDANRGRACAS